MYFTLAEQGLKPAMRGHARKHASWPTQTELAKTEKTSREDGNMCLVGIIEATLTWKKGMMTESKFTGNIQSSMGWRRCLSVCQHYEVTPGILVLISFTMRNHSTGRWRDKMSNGYSWMAKRLAAFPGVRELSFLQTFKHISTALFDSYDYFCQLSYLVTMIFEVWFC